MTRLEASECQARMAGLHGDWVLEEGTLTRSFSFKGFAKPVQLVGLLVWYAEKIGHHPDICFGFGHARVSWTTHDAGGLTEADFDAAAGLDRLL